MQAVLSSFHPTTLSLVQKSLWDMCKVDLEQLGLTYHQRRGSEKHKVADILLADILTAFKKLDGADRLPSVYCEAHDLIKLPSLVLDPVSKKLDANSDILESLNSKVQGLSSVMGASPPESLNNCCSTLNDLIANLQQQLDQFSSSIVSLSQFTDNVSKSTACSNPAPVSKAEDKHGSLRSSSVASKAHPPYTRDLSKNIILFGLSESSLLDTKSAIDNMTNHLIGNIVIVVDAVRLGCRVNVNTNSNSHPHPILIKLNSCWDKCLLLASCRKLKGYSQHKLFICEDLPPEARPKRRINCDTTPVNSAPLSGTE